MRLGSTVTGTTHIGGSAGMQIPASALTAVQGQPAVWVLDPKASTVSLRSIDVGGYELDRVLVAHGLEADELVVTAGVQTLLPGQQVRLLGAPPPPAAAIEPVIEIVPKTEAEGGTKP